MTKYILALCAIASLSACSGSAKASYDIEGDWKCEGWRTEEVSESLSNVEVSTDRDGTYTLDKKWLYTNVEVSPSNDGTYTVDKGGCVS